MTRCTAVSRSSRWSRPRAYMLPIALVVIGTSSLFVFEAAAHAARGGCRAQCRQECVATCRGTPKTDIDPEPLARGCDCQGACVNAIVSSCYAACADQCDGDTVALGVCQGACRDLQCDRLTKLCTDDGSGTRPYALCCSQCDN